MHSTNKQKRQKIVTTESSELVPLVVYYNDNGKNDDGANAKTSSPPPLVSPVVTQSDSATTTIGNGIIDNTLAEFDILTAGTEYVLTFDIEKSGEYPKDNFMNALGATVKRVSDRKIMSEFRVFFKQEEGKTYSNNTWNEYWNNLKKYPKNKDMLEAIKKHGVPSKEAIKSFADWLDTNERKYEGRIAITSDNHGSDVYWISYYFEKYLDRKPMTSRYGDETQYRRLHHCNAYGRGVSMDDGSGGDFVVRLLALGIDAPSNDLHDHDPLNDAKWMADLYIALIHYARRMRKAIAKYLKTLKDYPVNGMVCSIPDIIESYADMIEQKKSPFSPNNTRASLIPFWQRINYQTFPKTDAMSVSE